MNILQWEQQHEHFSKLLEDLTITGQFTDVTFVLENQAEIKSHKVILAAGSPLFQELLTDDESNEVITLCGIGYEDLETVLEFIYFGVASFKIGHIEKLHECAQFFQLKALEKSINKKQYELKTTNSELTISVDFPCEQCDKLFNAKDDLELHIQFFHDDMKMFSGKEKNFSTEILKACISRRCFTKTFFTLIFEDYKQIQIMNQTIFAPTKSSFQ